MRTVVCGEIALSSWNRVGYLLTENFCQIDDRESAEIQDAKRGKTCTVPTLSARFASWSLIGSGMGDKAYCTFRTSSGRCGPSDIVAPQIIILWRGLVYLRDLGDVATRIRICSDMMWEIKHAFRAVYLSFLSFSAPLLFPLLFFFRSSLRPREIWAIWPRIWTWHLEIKQCIESTWSYSTWRCWISLSICWFWIG